MIEANSTIKKIQCVGIFPILLFSVLFFRPSFLYRYYYCHFVLFLSVPEGASSFFFFWKERRFLLFGAEGGRGEEGKTTAFAPSMSRAVKREPQKKLASGTSGPRSLETTRATQVDRTRSLPSQPKKEKVAFKKSLRGSSNVSRGAKHTHSFYGPFPPLLRMPPVREMYLAVLAEATRKIAGDFSPRNGRNISGDENVVAAMFLRQLQAACAAYTGGASSDIGAANPSGDGSHNGSDAAYTHAGLIFYRHLYDLHRWLFLCGAHENGRFIVVKHAWHALFSKKLRSWRIFMSILGSDMIVTDENAASGFLTMLYNLLRNTSRTRRKRVVKMCCQLRFSQLCISILEGYEDAFAEAVRMCDCGNGIRTSSGTTLQRERGLQDPNTQFLGCNGLNSPPFPIMRVVEAAAMLLGLCGSEDAKVLRVVRRKNALSLLLRITELLFATVAHQLSHIKANIRTDARENGEVSTETACSRNEAQLHHNSIYGHVLGTCDALLHLIVALHQLAALPVIADLIGARGVSLCVQAGWTLHSFLSKTMHLSRAPYSLLQNQIETLAVWLIELFSRLCCGKRASKQSLEAARERGAVGMLIEFSTHPAGRAEIGLFSLNALNVLTTRDSGCREQLYGDSGGLYTFIRRIVVAAELAGRSPAHWHKLYLSLYALIGVVTIPGEWAATRPNENAFPAVRVVPTQSFFSASMPNLPPNLSSFREGGTTMPLSMLPVDFQPDAFSPELHKEGDWGFNEDMFVFSAPEELPWAFSEDGLPPSFETVGPVFPGIDVEPMESRRYSLLHTPEALQPPSSETRVRVLKHLIERLCTSLQRMDCIIYERPPLVLKPSSQAVTDEMMMAIPSTTKGMYSSTGGRGGVEGSPTTVEVPSLPGLLKFRSDFECGNLQRAVAIDSKEYDLVLSPDTNTNCHVQWFCFSVEDYTPGMTYRFNILNMEKPSSTFNEGQQPLMLLVENESSGTKASGLPRWTRCGQDIFYYRNLYQRPERCTTTASEMVETNGIGTTKNHDCSERTSNSGQRGLKKSKKVYKSKPSGSEKSKGVAFCYTLS
ncbi:zinc carboxypeptidase, putative, partial [Trypanosoma cruzi]